ncbi:unnamed protein product [Adineta steineri]|uniref:Hexosyltransferase n=1 Tax=Adineta steineri TaxID=433720 RepID=A0A814FL32_9BILA|nr:unnamed protein product [Adineta steineri]CAF1155526.1 unnamed protein product [Adineta steineri]
MIAIIIINQIINSSYEIIPKHCDAIRIQEYYMNNLSAYHILQTKRVHPEIFEYKIVNNRACENNNSTIDLLIFIISNTRSYERRNAIRRTYGNLNNIFKYSDNALARLEVRILFMINLDENRMKTVLYEQEIFNDIVQVLIPEYDSMNIYRDLSILDWSSKYCSQARFIFKMNDSVFLNPFLLLKFINENPNDRVNLELKDSINISDSCAHIDARLPLLSGFIHSNEKVLRQKLSTNQQSENFLVNKDEYPCDTYPNYLNDNAYLISNDARDLILCTFYRQSKILFPISNIYITGILPEYLHIERHSLINYKINFDSEISCEEFFIETNPLQAFACVTNIDLSKNIFEYYSIYWQSIINSQIENNEK